MTQYLLLGIAAALVVYAIWLFNRLIRDRNLVRAGHADIDVQLQRRHDLVPQLVNAVKGYAGFEQSLLTEITELRAHASQLQRDTADDSERDSGEAQLAQGLDRLLMLAEDYPDLKASENFRQLMTDLVGIENHLQHARRFYNGAVRQYNTHIGQFPDLLIARTLNFSEAKLFSAAIEARAVPSVAGIASGKGE